MSTEVCVLEKKQANGAARVRELIDATFGQYPEWVQSKTGDIDWVKRLRYNESIVSRIGVEIQVSGRSDLLVRDIIHIRNKLHDSHIDIGVIVVPSDQFEYYLTDRVANFSHALRYVEEELREAQSYPIILIGIEHDGYSAQPLPKKRTNRGKK
ncbi:MAG TPA: BglII/BstYI family type II restriction endonuclease [Acidobacteriota bacterium]|nr:BglII/BstYI family type II restriction endonuclease [Acidobacteriota bacterium]